MFCKIYSVNYLAESCLKGLKTPKTRILTQKVKTQIEIFTNQFSNFFYKTLLIKQLVSQTVLTKP